MVLETLLFILFVLASSSALAQSAPPSEHSDEQFSVMKVLTGRGLHDIDNESWNAYGQSTYISSWKPRFPARYTNLSGSTNSLLPDPERSFTGTLTLYLGARLWKGAEAYVVPEVISQRGFSDLRGLGGAIQNFELQKTGSETPRVYRSRAYIQQTFGLGGEPVSKESGPMQLGTTVDSRRVVLVLGNFSTLDFFDKNAFGIDPRRGLLSLAFLTYPAYDFAADARGYSWGGIVELYRDRWAVRFGHTTPPRLPNQLPIDFRLSRYYGDQVEIEHKNQFRGQDGSIRVLAYRNRENIGRFRDAISAFQTDPQKNATTCPDFNYGSQNENAPDLCWARRPNVKKGIGVFAEQYIAHNIGVFGRAMYSDGRAEVDAYTSTDRSVSLGLLAKGSSWSRPLDIAGAGMNIGWISQAHADYLRLGGIDAFIGDGFISAAPETAFDVFYDLNLRKFLWISGDYQRVLNPAFNSDRGPVNIFGTRIHVEF